MPRTTTPYRKLPRLFQQQAGLAARTSIELDRAQAHYLLDVMRRKAGDQVRLFDGQHGEWLATITETDRKRCQMTVMEQVRPQEGETGPTLLFAPIKKSRLDLLVEKATELGVGELTPVKTRRTIVDKVNTERLRTIAVEAAEQCERLTVPEIHELQTLESALVNWPAGRLLYVADESGGGQPLLQALQPNRPVAFLTGPEGGFDPAELERLGTHPTAIKVDLGPLILRSETAGMNMLACAQAIFHALE